MENCTTDMRRWSGPSVTIKPAILPTPRQMHYWRTDRDVNVEVKNAMAEFGGKYCSTELTVDLEEGKKEYEISVVLKAIDE